MPINKTRSISKKYMRLKGSTKSRPEQMLIAEIIKVHTGLKVKTEYNIPDEDLQPVEDFHLQGLKKPRPDIFFIYNDRNYIIRVNGPIHDEIKSVRRDRIHKLYLEMQIPGWIVIDAWYHELPITFSSNRKKLSPEKLKQAYEEIRTSVWMDLPEEMDQVWADLYDTKED